MSKNYSLPDYSEYRFRIKEYALYIAEGLLLVTVIGYFFYRSLAACIGLLPILFFFLREKRRELAKKQM